MASAWMNQKPLMTPMPGSQDEYLNQLLGQNVDPSQNMSTPMQPVWEPPMMPSAPMGGSSEPVSAMGAPYKTKESFGMRSGAQLDPQQEEFFQNMLQQRKADSEAARSALGNIGERPGGFENIDLSNVASAVDGFTGNTRFAQTYKAPTAGKEFDQKKAALEAQVGSTSDKLSDDQLKYLQMKSQSEDKRYQRELMSLLAKDRNAQKKDGSESSLETTMRKEWLNNATTKNSLIMKDGAATLDNLAANPSPAGDMAMVYSVMKILDPTSTVRESEYAAAAKAAGLPEQAASLIPKMMSGEKLTPSQRTNFAALGKELYSRKLESQRAFDSGYRKLAETSGANPDKVVLSKQFFEEAPSSAVTPNTDPGFLAWKKSKGIQ